MTSGDLDYYRMRAEQERVRAEQCDDLTARRVHLAMANRYSEKLREIDSGVEAA